MPIKMGEDTFWVDVCQEDKKTGVLKSEGTAIPEDSIMLKLDMEGNGMSNANPAPTQGRNKHIAESANFLGKFKCIFSCIELLTRFFISYFRYRRQ